MIGNISLNSLMFFFLYSLKPAEHTISAFMGAFLKEYLVKCETLRAKLNLDQLKHINEICHNDIYHDTTKQKLAVMGFSWLLDSREKRLEATTPASGATLVAALPGATGGYDSSL